MKREICKECGYPKTVHADPDWWCKKFIPIPSGTHCHRCGNEITSEGKGHEYDCIDSLWWKFKIEV